MRDRVRGKKKKMHVNSEAEAAVEESIVPTAMPRTGHALIFVFYTSSRSAYAKVPFYFCFTRVGICQQIIKLEKNYACCESIFIVV